jgi:ABC-type nickel/cobalt efflux system permease component RcnA
VIAPALSGTAAGVLGLGLIFGLRHATEADHIAAVSIIVSEKSGWRAALRAGLLWGAGHTLAILAAGLFVLGMRVVIPDRLARVLEFGVAIMIIGLGGAALARALRSRPEAHSHLHRHAPGEAPHRHLHFHDGTDAHRPGGAVPPHRSHGIQTIGLKPLLVGMMHGLAGSAALTLLVLAQIRSFPLGLLYLLVFGIGSIGGMALMSLLISLPFAATASLPGIHRALRVAAGVLSLAFGLVYAWSQVIPGVGA